MFSPQVLKDQASDYLTPVEMQGSEDQIEKAEKMINEALEDVFAGCKSDEIPSHE